MPVGVPVLPADVSITWAVSIRLCPDAMEFALAPSVVTVAAFVTVSVPLVAVTVYSLASAPVTLGTMV